MHVRTLSKQNGLDLELSGSGWRLLHFRSGVTTLVTLYHYTVHLSLRLHSHEMERVDSGQSIHCVFLFITCIYCVCVHNLFVYCVLTQ